MPQHPLLPRTLLPRKRDGAGLSNIRSCKRPRIELPSGGLGNNDEQRFYARHGDHRRPTDQRQGQLYKGMSDIPVELLLRISAHMGHRDLLAFAVTSRFLCNLLLPEYLRRRGLTLKDTRTGGKTVDLREPSGYASLSLWSTVPMFQPPEEMFCATPSSLQEAKNALKFLSRFLQDPSNTSNLRDFHFALRSSDPLLLMSELIKIQNLFCILPLTRLCISGFWPAACLPRPSTLRSTVSSGSAALTSLTITSDHAFAPGLVRATMGILKHSPIKTLTIWVASFKACQWSTLLGELNMTHLEDIELEGEIPQPALIRFLTKHSGLRVIRIGGSVPPPDCIQPGRSQGQHFLPHLNTLHAPLTMCCDVMRRVSGPLSLYELQVEVSQLQSQDPLLLQLAETMHQRDFRKLDDFGFHLVPSSTPAISRAPESDQNWDGHPVRELRHVRSLSFFQSRRQLSHGDIDVMCAFIRSFPMVERVYVAGKGDAPRMEMLETLRNANPGLRAVTVYSGSPLNWTADAVEARDEFV